MGLTFSSSPTPRPLSILDQMAQLEGRKPEGLPDFVEMPVPTTGDEYMRESVRLSNKCGRICQEKSVVTLETMRALYDAPRLRALLEKERQLTVALNEALAERLALDVEYCDSSEASSAQSARADKPRLQGSVSQMSNATHDVPWGTVLGEHLGQKPQHGKRLQRRLGVRDRKARLHHRSQQRKPGPSLHGKAAVRDATLRRSPGRTAAAEGVWTPGSLPPEALQRAGDHGACSEPPELELELDVADAESIHPRDSGRFVLDLRPSSPGAAIV